MIASRSIAEVAYDEYITRLRAQPNSDPGFLIQRIVPQPQDEPLAEHLRRVDIYKAWLDSFRPLAADVVAELNHYYDVLLTYNSNAIEGNTLTQSETEMVLEKGITVAGKPLVDHLEVIGHKDALDYVRELATGDTPIRAMEIRDIHKLIMMRQDARDAGAYRTLDVKAAGTEHVYPAHFLLPEQMHAFVMWLHSRETAALHPAEFASAAHYKLVCIHPFKDGNGRTARLLMNLILLRAGYTTAFIPAGLRSFYLDTLIHAQEHDDDLDRLTKLVALSVRMSLSIYLATLATAASSRGRGLAFYEAMLAAMEETP